MHTGQKLLNCLKFLAFVPCVGGFSSGYILTQDRNNKPVDEQRAQKNCMARAGDAGDEKSERQREGERIR